MTLQTGLQMEFKETGENHPDQTGEQEDLDGRLGW